MILKAACDAALADPELAAERDIAGNIIATHCNLGAQKIANAMGCHDLDDKMADQQYMTMSADVTGRWSSLSDVEAANCAQSGILVLAAMSSAKLREKHGHIAVLYPAPREFSGSLMSLVPMVANIGKENKVMRVTQAFPIAYGEPDYYAWCAAPD